MSRTRSPAQFGGRRVAWAIAAALALAACGGARAQSDSPTTDIDDAGPQAAARIRELEALTASLRRQVRDLQIQLDRIRGTDATVSSDAAPLDPFASPSSLLIELRRRYARQLGDIPRATPTQQERFEAQAERWCEKTRQEIRGRTRWLATVTDVRIPERGEPDALVRVLDEISHRPLGEAVRLPVTRPDAGRFESLRHAHELRYGGVHPAEAPVLAFTINTLVLAGPVFNAERLDAGVFNVPPIIGPCVEFGMRLDIDSIAPVELEPPAPAPARHPPPREDLNRPER